MIPREAFVPAAGARLYCRDVGAGQPIIVLHGGPDFDHSYLLPELDRLAESFHLVSYDGRGRGRSAGDVRPEDVSLRSEIEFIPVELAARIAQAVPGARLSVLARCGHFAYLESPDRVHGEIGSLLGRD